MEWGAFILCFLGVASFHQSSGHMDHSSTSSTTTTMDIKMPGARPAYADHYLCTAYPVNNGYVVGYKALAEASTAHHILLYACDFPHKYNGVWECGSICRGKRGIMFAWAKNAPPLHLPKDVGYQIGKDADVNYIVMQIHYAHALLPEAAPDQSGIQLEISQKRQIYKAGIYLLMSVRSLPKNTPVIHRDSSCKYDGPATIYPFGFRTHAHSLSRVITGYQYNGSWHEVGKGNPLWPQAFYPVTEKIAIKRGDSVVARCTYNTTGVNHDVFMGSTASDEMCNFYIMYYTDAVKGETSGMCVRNTYPSLVRQIPPDSDQPLPPNPAMDEMAKGHTHHHHHTPGIDTIQEQPAVELPPAKQPEMEGMDYYTDPYDEELSSYDYPQKFDPRLLGKFYEETETGRGRNRNRYPYFHQSEQEMFNGHDRYGGSNTVPANNRENSPYRGEVPNTGQANRSGWGSVSAKKGPGPRPRPKPSSRPLSTPRPHKASPSTPTPRKPSPTLVAVKPVPAGKWVHVPTTMVSDNDWPADDVEIGQVGGVSTDKDGNVYVFHRASRIWDGMSFNVRNIFQHQDEPIKKNTLLKLDRNGKVLKQWGANQFYMPHGIHVDASGNIWVTDVALHQVQRFRPDSESPDLVLGVRFEPGSDVKHFCKPADVAVLSNGDFFVADGYCNSRIMKFSHNGTLLGSWGSHSTGEPHQDDGYPPTNTFDVVHSVTVAEDKKLMCACDRQNARIQCYDLDGGFVKQITSPRFGLSLYGVVYCPRKGGMLFAISGPSPYHRPLPNGSTVKSEGFTINITSGEITGTWAPNNDKREFSMPHTIAVDSEHQELYVGDIISDMVWKFVPASSITDVKSFEKKGKTVSAVGDVTSSAEVTAKPKATKEESRASIIIGGLLVLPVVVMVVVAVVLRLRSQGKLQCCTLKGGKRSKFNYFTSHKGFDPLSTEDSDHEHDPLNDSDGEDFAIPPKA